MKTLGQRARARREELRLSQEKVGRYCKVSQEAIRQMESDELQRPPRYMDELLEVLQTTKQWLKDGAGPKENLQYSQDRPGYAGLGDTGYKGKRGKLIEMLDAWDTLSSTEREEFLAVATIHKKEAKTKAPAKKKPSRKK